MGPFRRGRTHAGSAELSNQSNEARQNRQAERQSVKRDGTRDKHAMEH